MPIESGTLTLEREPKHIIKVLFIRHKISISKIKENMTILEYTKYEPSLVSKFINKVKCLPT